MDGSLQYGTAFGGSKVIKFFIRDTFNDIHLLGGGHVKNSH